MYKSRPNILTLFSKFWIIFFPIASFYFYNYAGFNDKITKAIYFVVLHATIIWSFSKLINTKHSIYGKLIRNIFLLMILSMFMSYIFWGQNFVLSYKVTAAYMAIVYFFFLLNTKPDLNYVEKAIWFFCILYILLWFYGLMKAPTLVFGLENEAGIDDSRGFFRLHIAGRAFVILAFFMSLNKFVVTKKKKWIGIFILLFIVIVLQVIRQIIGFSLLIGLYYLLRKYKYLWIWLGLAGIILLGVTNIKIKDDTVIGKMIALSQKQVDDQSYGKENIRITEYRYFFTKYSKNIMTDILGNGFPHFESALGKKETKMAAYDHLYASDVGYAALFMRLGLLGLIFYGLIFYKVVRQKVPEKYMYAKLFILYMIFANISASWIFQDTIVICICLYILESCYRNEQIKYNSAKQKYELKANPH